jgi:colicin import membrane protein
MGSIPKITFEQVAEAAEALIKAGITPTVQVVAERLGSVSDLGPIKNALKKWRAERQRRVSDGPLRPRSLQQMLFDFMCEVQSNETRALEEKIVTENRKATDLAAEIERQAGSITATESTVKQLNDRCANLNARIRQLKMDAAVTQKELITERKSAVIARRELNQKTLHLEQLSHLKVDLTASENALKKEQRQRAKAEQQMAVLMTKLKAADQRIAEAGNDAAELAERRSQAATAHFALATANSRLKTMEIQLNQQLNELEAARKELQRACNDAAELKAGLTAMEAKEQSGAHKITINFCMSRSAARFRSKLC